MAKKTIFTLEDILEILPHRPPLLLVDRVTFFKPDNTITVEKTIREDEPWFKGHFPGKPVMPGVLLADALAQTSGLLWGFSKKYKEERPLTQPEIFFLTSVNLKFINPVHPGETVDLIANAGQNYRNMYTYSVEATAGRKSIVKGNLSLAMMENGILKDTPPPQG